MENQEIFIEELEVQDTFNEDGLELLLEDGEIENVEEVANNGNENN